MATPGSIAPASQVLMWNPGVLGVAQVQGIRATVTDPGNFRLIVRSSGGDATGILWQLSYAVVPLGTSGVPAAWTEILTQPMGPAGDATVLVQFPVTPGKISAGDLLVIELARLVDVNADQMISLYGDCL